MKTKRFKKLKSRKCKSRKCKTRKCKSRKCKNHNNRKKTRKNNYKKNKKGGGSCYSVKREDKSKHLQNFTHNKATLTYYKKERKIGEGGYGKVFEGKLYKEEDALTSNKHIGPLAIKIFSDDNDFNHEKMIVESLKYKSGCICSFESNKDNKTLISNIVCGDYKENLNHGFQTNNVIVMDIINNPQHIDFTDFSKNKNYVTYIEEIIAIILQTNLCLLDKGLFYCDYNLGNIAIDITDNTFSLTFLDYGAILPFNVQDAKLNSLYISTYPIFIDNIHSTYYNKDTGNKEIKMEILNYGTVLGPVELYATSKGLVDNTVKAGLEEEADLDEEETDLDEEEEADLDKEDIPASRNHQEWFRENNYKLALNNTILNIFNIICCLTAPSDEDNQNGIWEAREIFQKDKLNQINYIKNEVHTRDKKIKDVMNDIIKQHHTIGILDTLKKTLLENANFKTGKEVSKQQYRTYLNSLVSQICPEQGKEEKRIEEIVYREFNKRDPNSHPNTTP